MPDIEVVVVNYKRPDNLPPILQAFRAQSVPCSATVIECAPEPQWEAQVDPQLCDRRLRMHQNFGAYNRFLGGFIHEKEFTYFHDDDMLPGQRLLEHFLRTAELVPQFGVLGQFGRVFPAEMKRYSAQNVARADHPVPVDMIVRGYFVRTRHLHYMLPLKWMLGFTGVQEDDMLLSCGLRMFGQLQSYLTPLSPDPEEKMVRRGLPSPYACSSRPGHFEIRSQWLQRLAEAGWPNQPLLEPVPDREISPPGIEIPAEAVRPYERESICGEDQKSTA